MKRFIASLTALSFLLIPVAPAFALGELPVTPPADTTPPVISGVLTTSVSSVSETIAWTTNELAVSTFEYGTTMSYGSSAALAASAAIGGTATLMNLLPSTTYYYCIHATDTSNNPSSSCSSFATAAAPVVILPPVISLTAVTSIAASSAMVTWTTDKNADTQVEYGTTSSYGSSSTLDTTPSLAHSAALANLSPSTLYHYRVKSRDASGNLTTSSDATFMTNALPVVVASDTTPPIVSNVIASTVSSVTESIAWTTNELATSVLRYGTSTSYGSSATLDAGALLVHTGTILNLAPSTTYYYCIDATDLAGNTSHSCGNTFTTAAASVVQEVSPPIVSLITVSGLTTSSVTIDWTTNELANGEVEYGTTVNYGTASGFDVDYTLTDNITLTSLMPNTQYHYRVRTKDSAGNETLSADNTFTTDALSVIVSAPGVALAIVSIDSSSVATSSATVAWTTNSAAIGHVDYGLTTSYGHTVSVDISGMSQSVSLTGLTPNTAYHYRVTAATGSGDVTLSSDHTFTTPAIPTVLQTPAPVISIIIVAPIGDTSATVRWTTDTPSSSQIEYGTTSSYTASTTPNETLTLSHSVVLSNLSPNTNYYYRVASKDAAGNFSSDSGNSFTTMPSSVQVTAATISAITTASVDTASATITWNTDLPSDSQVAYGVSSDLGLTTSLDTALTISHSVTVSGLAENTNYQFKVKSRTVSASIATVSTLHEFNTLAPSAPVTTPANISAVSVTPQTTSATVSWTTDKNASSQVAYGISTAYGQETIFDSSLTSSHTVSLTALTPDTTYHYRVTSIDGSHNQTASEDRSFTTASVPGTPTPSAPTALSGIAIANHGSSSATLMWNAASASSDTAQIYDIRYNTSPITDGNFAQAIEAQLTGIVYGDLQPSGVTRTYTVVGLTPGATYYFAVKAKYENSDWSAISNIPSATLASLSISAPVSSGGAGAGTGGGGARSGGTGSAPAPTAITAFGDNAQVTLNWKNPTSSDFVRTIIVDKDGSYPTSPADGVVIYEGRGETFTDTTATNGGTDYYVLYGIDSAGQYSAPVKISVGAVAGKVENSIAGQRPLLRTTQYSFPDALVLGDASIEVQHLQQILVAHPDLYPQKLVTGYFGSYTKTAIQKFQNQQGLAQTGVADVKTVSALNALSSTDPIVTHTQESSTFAQDLHYGQTTTDVEALQQFLIEQGLYPEGIVSEYFGPLTRKAVIVFQQKHSITPAQGYVGVKTRTQIKSILGM